MTEKKSHEVAVLGGRVVEQLQHTGVSQVIDLGSGKGYLSEHLATSAHATVLGIDATESNTTAAAQRNVDVRVLGVVPTDVAVQARVMQSWRMNVALAPRSFVPVTGAIRACCGRPWPRDTSVATVDCEDFSAFEQLIAEHGDGHIDLSQGVCLVCSHRQSHRIRHQNTSQIGLHACGNLTNAILRLFRASSQSVHSP